MGTRDRGGLRLTGIQRARFLELIRDPDVGHVTAARQVGVVGSKGDIRKMVAADQDLQLDIEQVRADTLKAKGLGVSHLLGKLAKIVNDDGNASQLRAIERAFSLQGIHFKEQLEHSGQMEVRIPDVADGLERFTSLTAAAIRAAAREPAEQPALDA